MDNHVVQSCDSIATIILVPFGTLGIYESYGVATKSVINVGGVGGVATDFALKDVLSNVLSGIFIQFIRSFRMGDVIRAGSVDGEVIAMGLITTTLLSAGKIPMFVPNPPFSNEIIHNKSRASLYVIEDKIGLSLKIEDYETIPIMISKIKEMLTNKKRQPCIKDNDKAPEEKEDIRASPMLGYWHENMCQFCYYK
ncbi:OLC1v1029828C1 [Oldenlandia corymbosa var. corymbosa]|uniref:OLC1v1029828C1 n=1 Tax=Oldenlandia corymbosa var. corymbosa TaxID=529605 RepID=A0AAV1CEV8_OLDCO|nr:OLC1v1029828C1 [Oldenlandia corymbosa var. corymbosa]